MPDLARLVALFLQEYTIGMAISIQYTVCIHVRLVAKLEVQRQICESIRQARPCCPDTPLACNPKLVRYNVSEDESSSVHELIFWSALT